MQGKASSWCASIFSDPIGPLNIYNPEDLLTGKYGFFNVREQKFLKVLKLRMANYYIEEKSKKPMNEEEKKQKPMNEEEKEEYGTRLMRT